VAHDFNNILAVIQLQAALLKTEENISPAQLDFASEIEKAAGMRDASHAPIAAFQPKAGHATAGSEPAGRSRQHHQNAGADAGRAGAVAVQILHGAPVHPMPMRG